MVIRRCACGYPEALHGASGRCPLLDRGTFREPPVTVTRDWFGLRVPDLESALSAVAQDMIPRRPAEAMEEIAPASLKLGRRAVAQGCDVEPYYRVRPDGGRRCILRIEHAVGGFRAIAVWKATASGAWSADSAAVVGPGPVSMKSLGGLISAIEQ